MTSKFDAFFVASESEGSDDGQGYDSEAAEHTKGRRSTYYSERAPKRRKGSGAGSESDTDDDTPVINDVARNTMVHSLLSKPAIELESSSADALSNKMTTSSPFTKESQSLKPASQTKYKAAKKKTPGVVYLSSLPPYLRPSALRNLLTQRGFDPITRIFLAPASKVTRSSSSKSASAKSSKRQLYSEGWIEFASKSTAKRCAETLNAATVGGKKGGFYRDDVWNMKYLRGMRWEELMAGVREERREEEGRRDEERLILARETKRFFDGVEKGKKMKGIEASRAKRKKDDGESPEAEEGPGEVKRTWRQFEVKWRTQEVSERDGPMGNEHVSEEVKRVLGKIF